uniref:MFS domain-containing protein n=1 Tax=Meloidogyne hapla TaxID=6305 RepID=A0A1I8B908_MELHA
MEERWTAQLVFAVLSASIGSFEFGYNIGCINMPADIIKQWFADSYNKPPKLGKLKTANDMKTEWAVAVSIFAIGGIFGGLSVGFVADKLGRKTALLMNNVVALIATGFFMFAKHFDIRYLFIAGRLCVGLNAGLNSGLVPMYLTEISPANLRGTIGSFAQLFVTISILASQIVGLPSLLGTASRWPWIFYGICVEAELNQMASEAASARGKTEITYVSLFGSNLCWPLALSTFMMVSQQLSGINAGPNYATLAMGAINVLMTVVSVYLVDRLGRRTLLIGGFIGMLFTTAMIAVSMLIVKYVKSLNWFSYVSIASVLAFVISFAAGAGSIPWFFVSEVFPLNARGKANSIAVFCNWFFTFFVGMIFPLIESPSRIFLLRFHCPGCLVHSIPLEIHARNEE